MSVRSSFHSDSHRFVSDNNTTVFCLVFSKSAAGFPATSAQSSFARHCCWHRNFQLSENNFHRKLEFLVFKDQRSKYLLIFWHCRAWFLDSPFLRLFPFWCLRHLSKSLAQSVWPRGRFVFLSLSSRTMNIHPVVFDPIQWILWNLSTCLTIHDHQHPSNHQYFSRTSHLRMYGYFW